MKRYIRYPVIMAGAALMGFAVKNIYDPAGIVTGGFAGIAIIAAGLKAVPLWVTNMALNVPLFIMAWRTLGQKIIVRSLIAVVIYSASMAVSPEVTWFAEDIFISAAVGGLTTGLGMGLVLYAGGTSGGVDMLATLICHFTHKVRLQWVIFAADALIICAGAYVFGAVNAVYAVISAFAASYVSGRVIGGPASSRAVLIISGHSTEIAGQIMNITGRGVTGIDGTGMYTGHEGRLLLCIASSREIADIKDIIYSIDTEAFVTVSNVSEVLGEGFVKIK